MFVFGFIDNGDKYRDFTKSIDIFLANLRMQLQSFNFEQ